MAATGANVVLPCPACARPLRAPANRGSLWLTCPACQHRWAWVPPNADVQSRQMPDYYETLQVSPNAETEVIQAALRQLAKKYHPDKNIGDPTAEQTMKLLNEAREILCDPHRRKAYDEKRKTERADSQHRRDSDIIAGMSRAAAEQKDERRWRPKPQTESEGETAVGRWYITRDGEKRSGPFSFAELQQLAASGALGRADLVWMEGRDYRVTAESLCGLFPQRAPSATVDPPRAASGRWYILRDNMHRLGPYSSLAELDQLAASGGLKRSDSVWMEGHASWMPAESVCQFPPRAASETINSPSAASAKVGRPRVDSIRVDASAPISVPSESPRPASWELGPLTTFKKWAIAWGAASLLAVMMGVSGGDWSYLVKAPIACAVLFAIIAGVHYSRTPCPGCEKRWAGAAWDHPCKDGSPDLRYKNNLRRCVSCRHIRGGW